MFGCVQYPKESIKGFEHYYRESPAEPEVDTRIGTIVFMDIEVGPNVIEKGAWSVQEPKTGFEDFLDQIAFRESWSKQVVLLHADLNSGVKWKGDSGFGLKPTGSETGVAIDENWFG